LVNTIKEDYLMPAVLYDETIDISYAWEQGSSDRKHAYANCYYANYDKDLEQVIWQLAYERHEEAQMGLDDLLAGISEWKLQKSSREKEW
jgi:hypothetical protein